MKMLKASDIFNYVKQRGCAGLRRLLGG